MFQKNIAIVASREIKKAVKAINIANDGDLTIRLNTKGKNEIANMAVRFNIFLDKLLDFIKDTGNAVKVINDVNDIIVKINQSVETIAGQPSAAAGNARRGIFKPFSGSGNTRNGIPKPFPIGRNAHRKGDPQFSFTHKGVP